MNVFDLHAGVLADYRDFVRSFINVADPRAREIENALAAGALWPDPLLQLSPSYARADTVDELVDRGDVHRDTAEVFRDADGEPFRLSTTGASTSWRPTRRAGRFIARPRRARPPGAGRRCARSSTSFAASSRSPAPACGDAAAVAAARRAAPERVLGVRLRGGGAAHRQPLCAAGRIHLEPQRLQLDRAQRHRAFPAAALRTRRRRVRGVPRRTAGADARRRAAGQGSGPWPRLLPARRGLPAVAPGPRPAAAAQSDPRPPRGRRGRAGARGRRQPVLPAPLPGDGRRAGRPGGAGAYRAGRGAGGARTPGTALRLFADDGAGHRHRRARPRPHAQRAPDAGQLRAAQRAGRAAGAARVDLHLLRGHRQPRPVLLPAPGGVAGRGAGRAVQRPATVPRLRRLVRGRAGSVPRLQPPFRRREQPGGDPAGHAERQRPAARAHHVRRGRAPAARLRHRDRLPVLAGSLDVPHRGDRRLLPRNVPSCA